MVKFSVVPIAPIHNDLFYSTEQRREKNSQRAECVAHELKGHVRRRKYGPHLVGDPVKVLAVYQSSKQEHHGFHWIAGVFLVVLRAVTFSTKRP